ncbi:MAG: hypothetical protein PHD51_01750 [Patescibacteria group bacterium]|nr:hypothetical protein [Patescibacteria group bacterium]MDD5490413.1 hypothetical protein [Patescibacteria group bacterium]
MDGENMGESAGRASEAPKKKRRKLTPEEKEEIMKAYLRDKDIEAWQSASDQLLKPKQKD